MRTTQLRNTLARYEVPFQESGKTHFEMDDLEKAKLYARPLATGPVAARPLTSLAVDDTLRSPDAVRPPKSAVGRSRPTFNQ
jgi:hypothetical protein